MFCRYAMFFSKCNKLKHTCQLRRSLTKILLLCSECQSHKAKTWVTHSTCRFPEGCCLTFVRAVSRAGNVLEVLGHRDDDASKEHQFLIVQNPLFQPVLERSELERDISFCTSDGLCCVTHHGKARRAKGHSKGEAATLMVTQPQPNPGDREPFAQPREPRAQRCCWSSAV